MDKTDFLCVQTLTVEINLFVLDAVYRIAGDRMTEISHMYADLVRPSGFKLTTYMCIALITANHTVMSDGIFAVTLGNAHFFAVVWVSSDRLI